MSVQTVARRYAAALADVVLANNEAREVQEELLSWERMIGSSAELQEVLRNPTVAYDQKKKVLSTLIARTKVRPTTANFLQVLLQNHRLIDLHEINLRFAQVLDERAGVVSAEVTTARPIPAAAQENLRRTLASLTGQQVRLSFATDEELLGGIVTRIGSTLYDGSVRSQLQQVRERLAGKS